MSNYFDALETRSEDERAAGLAATLPEQIARAKALSGYASLLADVDAAGVTSTEALAKLPVLRKSEIGKRRRLTAPWAGSVVCRRMSSHIFSKAPVRSMNGGVGHDWWRMGRFLNACGIGKGDIVQNCFGYHLTPAGMIFENGARAVGAAVVPAGVGQTELQVRAAADIGTTLMPGHPTI